MPSQPPQFYESMECYHQFIPINRVSTGTAASRLGLLLAARRVSGATNRKGTLACLRDRWISALCACVKRRLRTALRAAASDRCRAREFARVQMPPSLSTRALFSRAQGGRGTGQRFGRSHAFTALVICQS